MDSIKGNQPAPQSVRVWILYRGSWVRLTLHAGDSVRVCDGGPNEEGYHYTEEFYSYDSRAESIYRDENWEARDCDGHHSGRTETVARLYNDPNIGWYGCEMRSTDDPSVYVPMWDRVQS